MSVIYSWLIRLAGREASNLFYKKSVLKHGYKKIMMAIIAVGTQIYESRRLSTTITRKD
jgi:hypothetical protein